MQVALGIRRDGNFTYAEAKLRSALFAVWAFGKNSGGQLGVGDFRDRDKPTRIESLDSMRIVQVAAGEEHCIALSCIGVIYTWGANDCGQLGRSAKHVKPSKLARTLGPDVAKDAGSVPHERATIPVDHKPGIVQYFKNRGIVSVQAGDRCSLLLGARNTGELSSIHVLAKEENESVTAARQSSSPPPDPNGAASATSTRLDSLVGIEHIGFVRSIACGSQMCGLLSQKSGKSTAMGMILRELASGELDYVNQLRAVIRHGLLPAYRALDQDGGLTGVLKEIFESLLNFLSEIWQMTCITAASFGEISNKGTISQLIALMESLTPAKLYRDYARCYVDAVANAVHKHPAVVRLVEDGVMRSNQKFFRDESIEGTAMFHRLLRLPLERMTSYELSFRRLGYLSSCNEENDQLCAVADEWVQLAEALKIATLDAEKTAQFWEENPSTRKQFAKPSRRMVCHSRTPNKTLHTRGLLSTATWIILFNDIVGLSQVFSQRELPLNLLWIQDTETTDDSNRHSFQIVSPAENLDVYADTQACKDVWTSTLLRCMCTLIKSYDTEKKIPTLGAKPRDVLSLEVPMELSFAELSRRVVSYHLKDDPAYGDATYYGLMSGAKISGHGKILTADGTVFAGNFEDGLCDGAAEMKHERGRKGVCLAKGQWRKGKLHGRALVRYLDGGEYEGDMADGIRHGHGCFQSDMDDCYVGAWRNDVYHGYGVYQDGSKGSSYLGMWEDGQRHGPGTVVLPSGEFYAGSFVGNRMTGAGHLLTEDNSAYEGEFVGDCHLQGRGKLTLSNGDTIRGMFNGHWSDKAGVKVNGVFQRNLEPEDVQEPDIGLSIIYGGMSGRDLISEDSRHNAAEGLTCKWQDVFRRAREALPEIRETILKRQRPYTTTDYKRFLANAFYLKGHPLCEMAQDVSAAFSTSYSKAGCHRRLLAAAVAELKSIVDEVDKIVVELFPEMQGVIDPAEAYGYDGRLPNPATFRRSFIEPLVHDHMHETLFALYNRTTKKLDAVYWNNVLNLNAVPDTLLFKRFCVPRRLWLMTDAAEASERSVLCMDSFEGEMPGSGRTSPLLAAGRDFSQDALLGENTLDLLDDVHNSGTESDTTQGPPEQDGADATGRTPPRNRLISLLPTAGLVTSLSRTTSFSRSLDFSPQGSDSAENNAYFDAIEAPGTAAAPQQEPVGKSLPGSPASGDNAFAPTIGFKLPAVDSIGQKSEVGDSPASHASIQAEAEAAGVLQSPQEHMPTGRLTDSMLQGEALAGERYTDAIATFKRLSKAHSPAGKLKVLHLTFGKMANAVSTYWDAEERLSAMDEVLPVFLTVLVRAQVVKLGAEIRFLQDFLDMDDLSGESKILLTTLQASYCQLQLERV